MSGSCGAQVRSLRRAALVLAAAMGSACAGDVAESGASPEGPAGTLRVALPVAPRSLNPNVTDETAALVGRNLFNQLVSLDGDHHPIPDLARAWEISADSRTYTFRLAEGVTWHDGRPFTSADVAWTLRALRGESAWARDVARRIAAVETPDAATVVVHLTAPWAPFLPALASYGTYILPRHRHAGTRWGEDAADRAPVGTGPFRFESWDERGITLAANPRYFRPGPYLAHLVYRVYPERGGRAAAALLRGDVDYTSVRPTRDRLAALRRAPGVVVETRPSDARYYLGFNLRRRPFSDLRVRRALNMAIDREALVARVLAGYGAPALGFYTPAVAWAYNHRARAPRYDPAAAAALLDTAGLRPGAGGVRFAATLVGPDTTPFPELASEVARQLAAVGVAVEVETLPFQQWLDRLFRRRDFDLGMMAGSHGPDPANLEIRFGSRGKQQFMGFADPELDALLARGASRADPALRARDYHRAQELLARALPVLPLAEAVGVIAHRQGLVGLPHREARGLVASGDFSLARWRP